MRDEIARVHGDQALQEITVQAVRMAARPDELHLTLRYEGTDHVELDLQLPASAATADRERAVRVATHDLLYRAGIPAEPQSVTDAARHYQAPDPMAAGGGSWAEREGPPAT